MVHKDVHFAKKNALKLDENLKSSNLFNSPFWPLLCQKRQFS